MSPQLRPRLSPLIPPPKRPSPCRNQAETTLTQGEPELIHRQPWPTRTAARLAINEYIGVFYNTKRRHSFLGHQSPVDFEDAFHDKEAMAA
jgi:hypothetical protein